MSNEIKTPRTGNEVFSAFNKTPKGNVTSTIFVVSELFARTLERETIELQTQLKTAVSLLGELYEKTKDFPYTLDALELNPRVKSFLESNKTK
jgi:hypothetical protein